ncbi:MAG: hypothetical protein E7157_04560 [Lactobacillales bacterium]|nr:hypothetical protein [Lactobacillales bacterium]
MNMSITEMMNYRFDNPEVEVEIDTKITEKFVERDREQISIGDFEAWGSVSKEAAKIEPMISAYKTQVLESTINKTI